MCQAEVSLVLCQTSCRTSWGFILMSVVNIGKSFMTMSSNISYVPFSLLSLLQFQLHMYLLYIFFCFRLNIFYYSPVQLRPYLLSSLFQMYLKILKTSIWSVVMNSRFLEKFLIIYILKYIKHNYQSPWVTSILFRCPFLFLFSVSWFRVTVGLVPDPLVEC